MSAPEEDVVALYDQYAPRLFAVALRILPDRTAAAAVLEQVFATRPLPSDFGALVRLTRNVAISRQIQPNGPSVSPAGGVPSPRSLVEDAFFRGRSVSELARDYGLDENAVRGMLRDGVEELRRR